MDVVPKPNLALKTMFSMDDPMFFRDNFVIVGLSNREQQ